MIISQSINFLSKKVIYELTNEEKTNLVEMNYELVTLKQYQIPNNI